MTTNYFNKLALPEWEVDTDKSKESGQAKILFVKKQNGTKGVFRLLKTRRDKDIKRFHRDLKILTNSKFQHPNIVKILEYSKSDKQHWYISRRGSDLARFRKKLRKEFKNNPDMLVLKCIELITDILDGLSLLHDQGIIHRDIKPKNTVTLNGKLVLIDFGLAYVKNEERISDSDKPIGNLKFSHDRQQYYIENPVPWFDVFMISQLLIWFVKDTKWKNWDRPLDWRFVRYVPGLSNDIEQSIRAITAVCSEESVSPQNANELKKLLANLFPQSHDGKASNSLINTDSIKLGIAKGMSRKLIKKTEDQKIITASFPLAEQFFEKIRKPIDFIFDKFINQGIQINKITDSEGTIGSLYKRILDKQSANSSTLLEYEMGDKSIRTFKFRINCSVFIPSLQINRPKLPDTSNIFTFYFQGYANLGNIPLPNFVYVVTIENNGDLTWRDEHMNEISFIAISEITQKVSAWISSPDPWEAIQTGR